MEHREAIRALSALGQDTRLSIFKVLSAHQEHGLPVGLIGQELGVPPGTLSFHLKELTNAGLVTSRRSGTFIYYIPAIDALSDLYGFLTDACGLPAQVTTVTTEISEAGRKAAA